MKKKKKTKHNSVTTTPKVTPQDIPNALFEYIKRTQSPVRLHQVAKELGIKSDSKEYDELLSALDSFIESGVITKTTRRRYMLTALHESTSFVGKLILDYETSGYVETESDEFPRIHIKRSDMQTALHGDTVKVKLLALRPNKKPRGEVVEILQRNTANIAGTIEYDGDFFFFVPDEENYFFDFLVPLKKLNSAKPGDKVLATFLKWDDPHKNPEAEVVEVLGRAGDNHVEFAAIIKEFRLPPEFPQHIEEEAKRYATAEQDISQRTDLRNELVITIDPDDAKDFDDALSLKTLANGNLELGVHIADVSAYLPVATSLDREASRRANSYYLVDRVIPMLPEVLSNNVCSLVPNQDRLTYSVFMEFSSRGICKSYRIEETIINSKRRYTYDEVQQIIYTKQGDNAEFVLLLYKLSETLRKRRYSQGGIDFETYEIRFQLDENKNPIKATQKKRTDATGLVEECMLAANKVITEHIDKQSKQWRLKRPLPFMYRIHDEPDTEKLRNALGFIQSLGVEVPNTKWTSHAINTLLNSISKIPESPVINQIMLRAQAKAVYASHNIGHFGLGFSHYSHFTSPIRRYPDVVVHRLLKEYAKEQPSVERIRFLEEYIEEVADHCSAQERVAVDAERASNKLAQTLMARNFLLREFDGTVTGITNFGIFVLMDEIFAEGLLHLRDIHGDYFYYDEKNYRLVGRKSKTIYRYGTRVRVQITNVNLDKREIDIQLRSTEA